MRKASIVAVLAASLLGGGLLSGCGYFPVPPDPIRIVDSPADVGACRRLGSTGPAVRTDGRGPFLYGAITEAVRVDSPAATVFGGPGLASRDMDHFGQRLNMMRDVALNMGATDLLLVRRRLRDWSYVEGVAYFCRH